MRPELWLMYAAAATLPCLTPGPDSLLALTSGAANGTRRALFTIAGSAARVLSWLRRERARRLFQRITGGAFVGAGVGLALSHG